MFKDSTCGTEKTKASVFLHGTLHWKNMGLAICRSTTSDFIKMANKIITFFTEQVSSSTRMLSCVNYYPPTDGDAVSSLSNPIDRTKSSNNNASKGHKDGKYNFTNIDMSWKNQSYTILLYLFINQ